ncbi:hypothetical protein [Paraburkholderia caledonica]|uniref:Spore coat protein n=1 Tax=Paraburkholderia caledonica TaxID=134536 RepID=A0ABU1KYY8_9BURK|nr:hypothetical protein [Paraburkholderia caledonica]MDR6376191.1 hypothetical protein [Paraburkholderia caledonica]
MSVQGINNSVSYASDADSNQTASTQEGKPTFQSLLKQLTDYTKGTANERIERQILARLGISEDELKKMSPEARQKVMDKVHELMKKEITAQMNAQKQKNQADQLKGV